MTHGDGSAERRVEERRKRLENAEQVFDDYLSSVAIEMRLPLRSILRLARLLGEHEGVMDAGTREYAEYIRASAEHMSVMLNDLRRPPGARQRSIPAGSRAEAGRF
jgi:signal transduction histidine kinase